MALGKWTVIESMSIIDKRDMHKNMGNNRRKRILINRLHKIQVRNIDIRERKISLEMERIYRRILPR